MGEGFDLKLPNGACFKLEVVERGDKKMIRKHKFIKSFLTATCVSIYIVIILYMSKCFLGKPSEKKLIKLVFAFRQ